MYHTSKYNIVLVNTCLAKKQKHTHTQKKQKKTWIILQIMLSILNKHFYFLQKSTTVQYKKNVQRICSWKHTSKVLCGGDP